MQGRITSICRSESIFRPAASMIFSFLMSVRPQDQKEHRLLQGQHLPEKLHPHASCPVPRRPRSALLFIIYHPDGIASAGHFCAFVTEIPVGVWYTLFKRAAGRPGSRCREPRRSSGADRKDAYDGILWISAAAGPGTGAGAVLPPRRNALLLDVRTQEEYADGHIPESRNLPLQTLRRTELLPPRPGDAPLRLLSSAASGAVRRPACCGAWVY